MTHYKDMGSTHKTDTQTPSSAFWTAVVLGFICFPLGILYALALLFGEKE